MPQTVAVVIVNYNGGEMLGRCLSALAKQTRQPERVVLVDNNSANFSADNVSDLYPGIEVLALTENTGFAAANNLAVSQLDDVEWLALLNPDAYPEADWLEQLLIATIDHPEFSLFGSHMMSADNRTMDGTGDVYHVSGAVWRRDYGKPVEASCQQDDEIFAPSAAAALIRRDAFLQADGFEEDFFCYMEDIDLGFRLRLMGHHSLHVSNACVVHEGSGVVGEYSDFHVYHGHRNLVWVFIRNMPGALFWLYLPQHLLYNLASIIIFILRGKPGSILRAKRDAIKGIARAWRQRKQIQDKSVITSGQLRQVMSRRILGPYLYRNE
jgi:GT2 family glycosyltransferase